MTHFTADTSRDALVTVRHDRIRREAQVLDGLQRYRRDHGCDPTAYELLRFLQIDNPTLDLNSARPRLTELEADHRVAKGEKRRCTITGRRVYSWAVVSPVPSLAVVHTNAIDDARQVRLL